MKKLKLKKKFKVFFCIYFLIFLIPFAISTYGKYINVLYSESNALKIAKPVVQLEVTDDYGKVSPKKSKYVTINVYNYNGSQNVSEVALTYDFYFKFLEYDYIPVEFELYYITGDEYIEIDEDWKTNYEFYLPAGEMYVDEFLLTISWDHDQGNSIKYEQLYECFDVGINVEQAEL